MEINVHQEAAKRFNERANQLVRLLRPFQQTSEEIKHTAQNAEDKFTPEAFKNAKIIDLNDIDGPITLGQGDRFGHERSRYSIFRDQSIGLNETDYLDFEKLVFDIQKLSEIRIVVSAKIIKDILFDWLVLKFKRECDFECIEYLLAQLERSIKNLEVWVPIASLHLQSPLIVGNVCFKPIDANTVKQWVDNNEKPEQNDFLQKYFVEKGAKFVNKVAGTVRLHAVPNSAEELASIEVDKSLSVLRLFSPTALDLRAHSLCTPLGKEHLDRSYSIFCDEKNKIFELNESIDAKSSLTDWVIDNSLVSHMLSSGLAVLSNLLVKAEKTEFENQFLDSIYLYSSAALMLSPLQKLVNMFAGLEMILLRDDNEPISQNIADRIAFVIGPNSDDRIRIVKEVKYAYKSRSRAVHHGLMPSDFDEISQFMCDAWLFYMKVSKRASSFPTKIEFLNSIDAIKYS